MVTVVCIAYLHRIGANMAMRISILASLGEAGLLSRSPPRDWAATLTLDLVRLTLYTLSVITLTLPTSYLPTLKYLYDNSCDKSKHSRNELDLGLHVVPSNLQKIFSIYQGAFLDNYYRIIATDFSRLYRTWDISIKSERFIV